MKKETLANHQPQVELPAGNRPITAPIYQTVKFTYDSFADVEALFKGEKREGFFYSRVSNNQWHPLVQVMWFNIFNLRTAI